MFFRTKQFLLLLSAMAAATPTRAVVVRPPHAASKISPEIINELKDFLDLIPTATVDEIVAKHYITDSNFREVLKYLRSTQFTALLQQAQQIPEVVEILDYLHLLVPSVAAFNKQQRQQQIVYGTVNSRSSHVQLSLEPQLNFVLLSELTENEVLRGDEEDEEAEEKSMPTSAPSLPSTAQSGQEASPRHLRTFVSFVEELLSHLPRDHYVQLINQKRQQNLAFAQFYAALRSAELRPMVDAAMKSSNLTAIMKTLSSNGVDVTSLETIAFKVISWGPVPIALP